MKTKRLKPPYAEVLWCDDVRSEVGNKLSVMGLYSGVMVVDHMPVRLARLAALVTLVTPHDFPAEVARVVVRDNTGKAYFETPEVRLDGAMGKRSSRAEQGVARFIISADNLDLHEGLEYIEVAVRAGGVEYVPPRLQVETAPKLKHE